MDDLFPPIDEALIKRLDEVYPESCADPALSDREIWMAVGCRQVPCRKRSTRRRRSGPHHLLAAPSCPDQRSLCPSTIHRWVRALQRGPRTCPRLRLACTSGEWPLLHALTSFEGSSTSSQTKCPVTRARLRHPANHTRAAWPRARESPQRTRNRSRTMSVPHGSAGGDCPPPAWCCIAGLHCSKSNRGSGSGFIFAGQSWTVAAPDHDEAPSDQKFEIVQSVQVAYY